MTKQEAEKKPCCCCSYVLGALVILFAWWQVSWGAVALTILGVVLIVKEWLRGCCCSSVCKTKSEPQK